MTSSRAPSRPVPADVPADTAPLPVIRAAYRAHPGFEADLEETLRRAGARLSAWQGDLALSPDAPVECPWALDIWTAPRLLPVPSIKGAAGALRGIQRNWALCSTGNHRRAALIEDLGRNPQDEMAENSERAIDVQITRLRRNIEPDPREPRFLQTVRGTGYMLVPD